MKKKAVIYARVSTNKKKANGNGEKEQNPETQLIPLRERAAEQDWKVVGEYVDQGVSGSKARRPQLDALMEAVRKGRAQVVLVARFDRFARSVHHLVEALEEFDELGVDFVSLNESIDTSTPMGKLVFTILGAVAELERSLIIERVNAGLDRARKQGKRLGRKPKFLGSTVRKAEALRSKGLSLRSIGRQLGMSATHVQRLLKEKNTDV